MDAKSADGHFLYNRLALEKSPYLLQHAHNPVNWYPWGDEAFAKARKENKPVFLSIGYSTCHWCHVMEAESFSDPAVAKLINDNFVPIKVDREERPDVDRVYMTFVQATTGGGGWPMTVFLTPDRKPFFGGTYFPAEDKDGMTGLKTLLPNVAKAWAKDHEKIVASADQITRALKRATAAPATQPGEVNPAAPRSAFRQYKLEFDPAHGGFGQAPKFPEPAALDFLFRYYARTGSAPARDMALQTLRAMAAGGIHDQLGGGFHRYSTDARWFLPHFEKMLYDQAQLADAYLDAWQITHDPAFAGTARDILDYVLRDMTGPAGQFYCAQDADSPIAADQPDKRAEGRFYVWTAKRIEQVLGKDASPVFEYCFGVKPEGNVVVDPRGEFTGRNVLFAAHTVEEAAMQFGKTPPATAVILRECREKLFDARRARPHPRLDDKTLVAWNGLMISAFARAGVALDEPRYSQAAAKAAGFIWSNLYDAKTHRLTRRWRDGQAQVGGFLSDYAFLIQGLLDLYESNLDIRWLKWAIDLQTQQHALFWDEASNGYFDSAGGDASILPLPRTKENSDNAEPAGNSVAALNLLRLSQMTDDKALHEEAAKTMRAFAGRIGQSPTALPLMLAAYEFSKANPRQIVLAGKPDAPDTRAMLHAIGGQFLPDKIILGADGAAGQQFLSAKMDFLRGVNPIDGKATAYVCQGYVCQQPTHDIETMLRLLGVGAAINADQPATEPTHR